MSRWPKFVKKYDQSGAKSGDHTHALRSHYGFDSFFCRPGIDGAHEKGGVEGEIGRFRRRHLVPSRRSRPWPNSTS